MFLLWKIKKQQKLYSNGLSILLPKKNYIFKSYHYFFLKGLESRHLHIIFYFGIINYSSSWLNLSFQQFQVRIHDIQRTQNQIFYFEIHICSHSLSVGSHFILWNSSAVATTSDLLRCVFLFYIWSLKRLISSV